MAKTSAIDKPRPRDLPDPLPPAVRVGVGDIVYYFGPTLVPQVAIVTGVYSGETKADITVFPPGAPPIPLQGVEFNAEYGGGDERKYSWRRK